MFGVHRHKPGLIVHRDAPLNAEPQLEWLRGHFLTDPALFYVRSHGDMPDLDANRHAISVGGAVGTPLRLTLRDLQAGFSSKIVTAVLQCAGNRRADLQEVRPTSGDLWAAGAIGNARWTGVPLRDILTAAGARTDPSLHVAFEGADTARNETAPDAPFGVSIPMLKALDEDVLVAWAMNDQPLAREHGAPLRMVVPGYAGVRSTKWLQSVVVQDRPSDAFQQAHDYLLFPPDCVTAPTDAHRGVAISAMPLNAAICEPAPGAALRAGPTVVRGYAIATDRAVIRVDVSADGGRSWMQATIEDHGNTRWSWTFWHTTLMLPNGEHELAVRAWDAAGQTQPSRPEDTWNPKGYLNGSWHRIRVSASEAPCS